MPWMSHIIAQIFSLQSFMQAGPLMKIFVSPRHHLWVNDVWDLSKKLTPENLSIDFFFYNNLFKINLEFR